MSTVTQVGDGIHCIDLQFQGRPGVIASYLIEDEGERALIETGPGSTLDALLSGLESVGVGPETISKLLVTHVHLDHAGAAGSFIERFPQARLFVHEKGARHMIDPEKLLRSATRIYGDMMEPLWGAFEPVPEEKITVLTDGDVIPVGSRRLTALYTPGHASHHVIYHDPAADAVFTGDVAAVRLDPIDHIRPPTPPPDVDLDLWSQSLDRIRALRPRVLYLTHFGPSSAVEWHLREARHRLYAWSDVVREALRDGQGGPEIADMLRLRDTAELCRLRDDASLIERYDLAAGIGMSVDGLIRYFEKRAQAAPRAG